MSQENIDVIRRGFEHFEATGEPIWEDFAETIEIRDHQSPDQGYYVGHAGWKRWIDDWSAAWSEWSIEVEDIREAGDSVLVLIHHTAQGSSSGLDLDSHDGILYGFRDGKVVTVDYYTGREHALEAAGLVG
ncbi:MAG: nuclear transport factor 2 family protein [Thermoleophilaceae bacterium]|jgi:ketosteroid isomerase-like protein